MTIDLAAEAATADALLKDWVAKKAKLDATIAECTRTKTTPGDHYWVAEHEARRKVAISIVVLEALIE